MPSNNLKQRILDFIRGTPADFDALALEVFALQFEHNEVYQNFCEMQRRTPATVKQWRDIPAVPTSAFKDFTLTCFPVKEAVAEFHTSGTTRALSGKHYFQTLELYETAIVPNFRQHLLPDAAQLPMLSLVPTPATAPHSSLSHMMGVVLRELGAPGSGFIERPSPVSQPVCLLGTAFAFLNLFDAGISLRLPDGSRAMETGGFKGRTREVPKRELYRMFEKHLGLPASHVVNEYGMTELSTQFYDQSLIEGRQTDRKVAPAWSRVLLIDPKTGREAEHGKPGLIRVLDLANLGSILCVQTEDLGVANGDGFEVLGRAPGAEVRGCSLNAETLLGR